MNTQNFPMNDGLGDAVMDSAIKLERFFFEKHPGIYKEHKKRGKLTLGNPKFEEEVKKLIPGKSKEVFTWFVYTRNSILHYGDSVENISENEKTRMETTANDIRTAGHTLLTLLHIAKNSTEDDVLEACKYCLTPRVFDQVFGSYNEMPSSSLDKRQTPPPSKSSSKPSRPSLLTAIKPKRPVPEAGPKPQAAAEGTGKRIIMKPPIIVKDLAARLGVKPFEMIGNLMKLGVFANQNQTVEPEIATKICELHGHTFECEKGE